MSDNMPVYNWDDAVEYILSRSDFEKDFVEKVLELEEEYMRNVGIISEADEE